MSGVEYYDYDVNDNGTIRHFGRRDKDYLTDVLRRQTTAFIAASAAAGKPFFAYVAPTAPHHRATPARRDLHTYDGLRAARPPSFNEGNVSDKPPWIRGLPKLSGRDVADIDRRHESHAESLQALDDLVEGVVNKLNRAGVMSNTYVFFTSDQGRYEGEHRILSGKARPYEENIHVPLLVRGPGVAAGSSTQKLALNTDYLPTFTDFAGVGIPGYVDGRSLRPVLRGNATTWRNAILLEARRSVEGGSSPAYYGIRTTGVQRKYIEYAGGARELYHLGSDPYELTNKHEAAPPEDLKRRLATLKSCSGDGCRRAENGPRR